MRKRISLVLALLFGQLLSYSQYTHFNEIYYDPMIISTGHFKLSQLGDTLVSTGYGGGGGFVRRSVSTEGAQLSWDSIVTHPYYNVGVGGATVRDNYLIHEGEIYSGIGLPPPCGGMGYAKFDWNFNLQWYKPLNDWEICDTLEYKASGFCTYNDESCAMLVEGIYISGFLIAPDSIDWRVIRIDFETGDIIANSLMQMPQGMWTDIDQFRHIGNHYYLMGRYRTGYQYDGPNPYVDWKGLIIKCTEEGQLVDYITFGQDYHCPDKAMQMEVNSAGNIVLLSDQCQDQYTEDIFPDPWKRHSIVKFYEIDPDDMSILKDVQMPILELDDWIRGVNSYTILEDAQGDYVFDLHTAGMDGPLHLPGVQRMIKIDHEANVIWNQEITNLYTGQDNMLIAQAIYEFIQTSDGGYATTGQLFANSPEVDSHWIVKLDHCGYDVPSTCEAVEGVTEMDEFGYMPWPNPFRAVLKAHLPDGAQKMYITDAIGREVYAENIYYPQQQWNLKHLQKGVYVMHVVMENGHVVARRIVKE